MEEILLGKKINKDQKLVFYVLSVTVDIERICLCRKEKTKYINIILENLVEIQKKIKN